MKLKKKIAPWRVKHRNKATKEARKQADMSNRSVESQSHPLSGASIYILADDRNDDGADEMAFFVQALGGDVAQRPEDATHAIWVPSDEVQVSISPEMEQAVVKCQALDVLIVDSSWLERMSGLGNDEHWSEIDVGSYVPAIVAMVDDASKTVGEKTPSIKKKLLRRGRDAASRLSRSISETFVSLVTEDPDLMEEDAIRRAMELSMLDCALVYRTDTPEQQQTQQSLRSKKQDPSPHEVLGVDESASPAEITAAYRKLALKTHPDKGGSADEFSTIARAYRSLLHVSHDTTSAPITNLKSTAHWDSELQDHRRLVEDLFQHHGADIAKETAKQSGALEKLGLVAKDAGMYNINEKDQRIGNSCFYLSLASSYLRGIGAIAGTESDDEDSRALQDADDALTGETALQLKRIIEAAVVKAHPEWAHKGMVGEEVQAFSDFLVYTLDSPTLLSDWAVTIFDTTSGFVDVYKGKNYSGIASNNEEWAISNTITLRYIPGHYQPMISKVGAKRPTLERVLSCLDEAQVYYVVTDGAA